MTEPIIPVKPGGEVDKWWQQVVSLSRADVTVNVDVPPDDASAAAKRLGMECVPIARIDMIGLAAFTVHPAAVGPASLPDHNAYVIPREDSALWEATGAGDLTVGQLTSIPSDALEVRRASDDEVARAQLAGRTLVERTCAQFGEHWGSMGSVSGPAIVWVTEPEYFRDCIAFWNLRALRPLRLGNVPMLLLPEGQVQYWLGFPNQLAFSLERPDDLVPDVALCSNSVSKAVLDETASLLGLQLATKKALIGDRAPAPMRRAPFTYLLDLDPWDSLFYERFYGEVTDVDVQLFRDKTTVRFTSPVSFRAAGTALVRLSGPPFDGLPRRQAVASRINNGGTWNYDALQITALATNDYLFELQIPELSVVTDVLLGEVTVSHELSVKGKPGMEWLDRTDISPLLESRIFSAIRELTTPRSKQLVRELRRLRADGAVDDELAEIAAHWGGRVERSYKSVEQLKHVPKEEAPRALERLCEVGWAERGLRLTCRTCGLPSFVALPNSSGRAMCPGCNSPGRYDTGAALTVYYRLNSYLDIITDQGVLPHLITIAALQRGVTRSYFLPGVDISFGENDIAEVDIFGVRNGQILNGEVKTSASEFTPDQIVHDVTLSSRLGADIHVLASTDVIPSVVREKVWHECQARELGLIVLDQADLLPGG